MLLLCEGPNPVPVILNDVPIGPEDGEIPVIVRLSISVNCTPLLTTPPTVTVTGPLVAFGGTETLMLVLLQESTLAVRLLNWTVLLLWLLPNDVPAIVIRPPIGAAEGVKLEIAGVITEAELLTATWSNVPVAKLEYWLLTAKPMYTFVAIDIVWDVNCVQFTPSGAV
jgi:hypothetical protein